MPQGTIGNWYAVASSADGRTLLVGDYFGFLYVSTDFGATWLPQAWANTWYDTAVSGDGSRLFVADSGGGAGPGGLLYVAATAALAPPATGTTASGPVYVGGDFTTYNGRPMQRLAVLDVDGQPWAAFGTNFTADGAVRALAVGSPQGTNLGPSLYIGGSFLSVNGSRQNGLARLNADGTLDPAFNIGAGANNTVYAIATLANGQVLVGGDFLAFNGAAAPRLVRLNGDGSVDFTFNPGAGADQAVRSLAVQTDGRILVTGEFLSFGGVPYSHVARLNTDGSVDLTFDPGQPPDGPVYAVKLQSDGRILIAGDFTSVGGNPFARVARLNTDGSLDVSFNPGSGADAAVYALSMYGGGSTPSRVAVGGDFIRFNDVVRNRVAILDGTGALAAGDDPAGAPNLAVYSIGLFTNAARADLLGKLVVGGDFTAIAGAQINHVARLNIDGTIDTNFNVGLGPDQAVRTVALQADGRVIIGGAFTNVGGVARAFLARFLTNGMPDPNYNSGIGPDKPVNASVLQPDGRLLIGGEFTRVYGALRNGVARMLASGVVDDTFLPGSGANGAVKALARQPDGRVLIGGDFTSFAGSPRVRVARLTALGALDASFDPGSGADGAVNAIALQSDGKILVGGEFTSFRGVAGLGRIVRLNADGTVDGTFSAGLGGDDYVSSITLQPDGKILVGGSFVYWNGQSHRSLVRLNSDGSVDGSINFGAGANNFIAAVAYEGYDSKIVVGGAFTEFDGEVRIALARLFGGTNTGAGAFQFGAPVYTFSEDASNAVVTVLRTGGANGTVSVQFTTANDTAQAGVQYQAVSGTLVFTNGEVEQTITIPLLDNPASNPTLAFTVTLTQATGGAALGTPSVARVNILNVDSVVGFTSSDVVVVEGNVSARVTVARSGGLSRTVIVDCLALTNGTATPYAHFIPIASVLTFNPGVSSLLFNVPILDNPQVDPPLTVPMVLSNLVGRGSIGLGSATLTILEKDPGPGVLSFSTNAYSVLESAGTKTITVVRTGGFSGQVSVQFNTANGTALAGRDYVATNGVITFADGQTNKTFQVIVINRAGLVEGTRSALLQLSNPTGGATLGQATASLSILDQDSYGSFVFRTNTFTVVEGTPMAVIDVRRVGGSIGAASVTVQTLSGSAVPNVDYTVVNTVLNFAAGQTTNSVLIPIANDSVVEDTETVELVLSTPTGGATIGDGGPATGTLLIFDKDQSFTFTAAQFAIYQTNRLAIIPVLRFGNTNGTASVTVSTANGTALAGLNYVATNSVLTFLPGETNKLFFVSIIDDNIPEGDTYLNLTLSNPTAGGRLGPILTARLYILDNNVALNFSSATYTVVENFFSQALITVVRSGATNLPVAVDYAITDGTAVNGVNYFGFNGSLLFNPGVLTNSFIINILNDGVVTGDLTVNLALQNPTGGALLGGQSTAVLIILERDMGVGFSSTNYVVNEAATNALITLVRRGPAASSLSVDFVTANGTALAGSDYVYTSNRVTWPANDLQPRQVIVPITKDALPEGVETVRLQLLNAVSGGTNAVVINPPLAILNIVDNAGNIAFATVNVTNVLEGQEALITLVRTGGSNGIVTVDYQAVGGTATAGADFLNPTGTVAFADGETVKTFTVPIELDSLIEGMETIQLALLNPTGGALVGSPSQMTITILDQNLGVLIPAGSALAAESGPVNGIIDPGETVTMFFALRNVGLVNTTNLVGILLATNGVAMTDSSLTQTQAYGTILAGGASVSAPFTFRAVGTNGTRIVATLVLKEGANSPYTNAIVNFAYTLGSATYKFANASPITIADNSPASPYPAVINVAGIGGPVGKVTVTLSNLTHTWPGDIDMLLVGPQGQQVMLMSDVDDLGQSHPVTSVTLTFDDSVTNLLPRSGQVVGGTYHPVNYPTLSDPFPAPSAPYAPILTPYATNLSVFNGTDPNGAWQLYVVDDSSQNIGTIAGGWSLTISSSDPILPVADLSVNLSDSPDPVVTSGLLTYVSAVTNHGPAAATGISLTNTLPAGVTLSNVVFSPGTYEVIIAGGITRVIAHPGTLANGAHALLTVQVIAPLAAGQLLASASVGAAQNDLNPGDNAVSAKSTVVVLPTLTVARKGGSILLSWPSSSGGYGLQSTPTLNPPVWTAVGQPPVQANGTNTVSLPIAGGAQFYRLFLGP